jgi:hypothetical protein
MYGFIGYCALDNKSIPLWLGGLAFVFGLCEGVIDSGEI